MNTNLPKGKLDQFSKTQLSTETLKVLINALTVKSTKDAPYEYKFKFTEVITAMRSDFSNPKIESTRQYEFSESSINLLVADFNAWNIIKECVTIAKECDKSKLTKPMYR